MNVTITVTDTANTSEGRIVTVTEITTKKEWIKAIGTDSAAIPFAVRDSGGFWSEVVTNDQITKIEKAADDAVVPSVKATRRFA